MDDGLDEKSDIMILFVKMTKKKSFVKNANSDKNTPRIATSVCGGLKILFFVGVYKQYTGGSCRMCRKFNPTFGDKTSPSPLPLLLPPTHSSSFHIKQYSDVFVRLLIINIKSLL